jgi:predicted ATPase/DNA-binding XRE family transcriptional regulator
MDMSAVSFGQWVKQRRKDLDLTQEELALRVNCSLTLIQKIEAGARRPSRQIAELLAECLAVPEDERLAFVHYARGKHSLFSPPQDSPWRALRRRYTNLPIQPTPIFGREQAVERIKGQLSSKQVRLLTLVGPPGVGKTRLGLEISSHLVNEYEDGVFLVSLAAVTTPEMVISSLAKAFNLPDTRAQEPLEQVKTHLMDKRLLLMLDNLEQVVSAAPLLADLLASCPWIQILATSRVSLYVRAERQYRVHPLKNPQLKPIPELMDLLQYPVIALFIDRAQAIDPDFILTSDNAGAIAEICARLNGLPLAIELVVGHIRDLPVQELLPKLSHQLPLLTDGPQDLPMHHRSLREAIGWSYALLDPDEKRIFARLGVFIGGCPLDAVQFVCLDDSPDRVLDAVTRLVGKNLVIRYDEAGPESSLTLNDHAELTGEPRYALLEAIREFALECLEQSVEADEIHRRHAACFLDLLERSDPVQNVWLDRLECEHDNLRAALRWSCDGRDAEKALRIVAAAWQFWQLHGHLREGLAWLKSALDLEVARPDPSLAQVRARALLGSGWLLRDFGDWLQMRAFFEDSLKIYAGLQEPSGLAYALYSVGYANFLVGDSSRGIRMIEESLDLYRYENNMRGIALTLMMLGRIAVGQGNYAIAETNFNECLQAVQQLGSNFGYGLMIGNLGELAIYRGDYEQGSAYLEQSQAILNHLGEKQLYAWVLVKRAELAWCNGHLSQARELLEESMELARKFGYRWNEAYSLNYLGLVTLSEGDAESAQVFCEASLAIFQELCSEGDIAQARKGLARVELQRGHYLRAEKHFQECLHIFRKRDYIPDIAECLEGLVAISLAQGDFSEAVRFAGAAQGLREAIGSPLPPVLQDSWEGLLKMLHDNMDETSFATIWKEGLTEGRRYTV